MEKKVRGEKMRREKGVFSIKSFRILWKVNTSPTPLLSSPTPPKPPTPPSPLSRHYHYHATTTPLPRHYRHAFFSRSEEQLVLNRWYVVRAWREGKAGSLQVDEGIVVRGSGSSGGEFSQLTLSLDLFVGGHRNVDEVAKITPLSLDGCVQEVGVWVFYSTFILFFNHHQNHHRLRYSPSRYPTTTANLPILHNPQTKLPQPNQTSQTTQTQPNHSNPTKPPQPNHPNSTAPL